MSQVLVTGGAGFIGSHLVHALIERGREVRVLDNLETGRLENLAAFDVGPVGSGAEVEFHQGSITDPNDLIAVIQGCDAVLHHAAQVSVPQSLANPTGSFEVNASGTLNVLEIARAAGVRKVNLAASSAAYGNQQSLPLKETLQPQPLSPYAAGKVAAEHLMRAYGLCYGIQTVSLRYFNVFGPRQADDSPYTGVIAIYARALLEGRRPVIYGDGLQSRDFTHVDNVVAANMAALENDVPPGSLFNVGSGDRITLLDMLAEMGRILNVEVDPIFEPERAGDVKHSQADASAAHELLGWSPCKDWRTGLAETVAWYRETIGSSLA